MKWQPIDSYNDPIYAKEVLTELLTKGSLSLFLGAGVSSSSKEYPNWVDLVRFCLEDKHLSISIADDEPSDSLLTAMERVRDKCADEEEYKAVVSKYLNMFSDLDYKHAKNMLLVAIGSLVMPSKRGSINEIVTYNFDDLIEWYLDLHGFSTQVVSNLPYLSKSSDVTIFHPHGFLPKSRRYSVARHFVFDKFAYDLTIGNEKYPWFAYCKHLLMHKIALLIGISGDDPAIRTLFAQTYDELKKQGVNRPVAFLINKSDSMAEDAYFNRRGIVPIRCDSYDAIWKFVLDVCQNAAGVPPA